MNINKITAQNTRTVGFKGNFNAENSLKANHLSDVYSKKASNVTFEGTTNFITRFFEKIKFLKMRYIGKTTYNKERHIVTIRKLDKDGNKFKKMVFFDGKSLDIKKIIFRVSTGVRFEYYNHNNSFATKVKMRDVNGVKIVEDFYRDHNQNLLKKITLAKNSQGKGSLFEKTERHHPTLGLLSSDSKLTYPDGKVRTENIEYNRFGVTKAETVYPDGLKQTQTIAYEKDKPSRVVMKNIYPDKTEDSQIRIFGYKDNKIFEIQTDTVQADGVKIFKREFYDNNENLTSTKSRMEAVDGRTYREKETFNETSFLLEKKEKFLLNPDKSYLSQNEFYDEKGVLAKIDEEFMSAAFKKKTVVTSFEKNGTIKKETTHFDRIKVLEEEVRGDHINGVILYPNGDKVFQYTKLDKNGDVISCKTTEADGNEYTNHKNYLLQELDYRY